MLAAVIWFALLSSVRADDALISQGFEHFYNLEYTQAIQQFSQAVERQPNNPDRHNYLAQAILYRHMLRAGALESELVSGNNPFLRRPKTNPTPEEQEQFRGAVAKSMELCQARLRTNPRDVGALYALGVAYGLRANYDFLVRKAWMDALRDATRAREAHNKAMEADPTLVDALLVQGLHDYVVGSLPFHLKILGFLTGVRGDREGGIRQLETVARNGDRTRDDAKVLLAAIYRREKRAQSALPLLEELIQRYPRNYLLRFEMAQMYSDTGRKDDALRVLHAVEKLQASGASGYEHLEAEKIDYIKGNIQFWYNDLDSALENMRRATANAGDLDLNTGVLAWMRLGQIYDLKGRREEAIAAYRQAILFAPESEAAKESKRYISDPYERKNG